MAADPREITDTQQARLERASATTAWQINEAMELCRNLGWTATPQLLVSISQTLATNYLAEITRVTGAR